MVEDAGLMLMFGDFELAVTEYFSASDTVIVWFAARFDRAYVYVPFDPARFPFISFPLSVTLISYKFETVIVTTELCEEYTLAGFADTVAPLYDEEVDTV